MKVDGGIGVDLTKAGAEAKELEEAGYSGVWTAETSHDPFLPLVLAAEHTEQLELGTSIAVAFARNPMTLANIGYDLQAYSKGRFILGLGSQIKPHITKRFSMPWSHPAPRMREMILAIRAIWDCWNNGTKLDFRGDFYTHTLMTPFFNPGPNPYGDAEDLPRRRRRADDRGRRRGRRRVPLPRLHHREVPPRGHAPGARAGPGQGRQDDGRLRDRRAERSSSPARNDEEIEPARRGHAAADRVLRLDARVPARCSSCTAGASLQDELNALSKQGEWVEMGKLIDDEILNTFAVVGEPEEIAPELHARYGDCIQRISFYAPYKSDPERWRGVMEALKAA